MLDDPRLELLRNMPIFGGVSAEVLALILELAEVVEVGSGRFFFREGDEGRSTFVLERGRVAILKAWGDGERRLRELGPGDCFGEMSLIDLGRRSASVRAEEDASALELSASHLLRVQQQSLEQFALIYTNMARELSRRLRAADERLFRAMAEARAPDDVVPSV